jgi:hypothetical protein
LKIRLPQLERDIKWLSDENCRLQYEIERIENPTRLIELAHRPEFGNLKHPLMKEVLILPEGVALKSEPDNSSSLW